MKYTGSCSPFEGSESVITQVRESGAACSCIWSASLYRVLLGVVDTSHSGEPHMGPTWDQSGLEVGRVDRIWVETGIKVGPIWVADLSLSDLKGCVLVEMSRDFGGLGPQQRCGRSLTPHMNTLASGKHWIGSWGLRASFGQTTQTTTIGSGLRFCLLRLEKFRIFEGGTYAHA